MQVEVEVVVDIAEHAVHLLRERGGGELRRRRIGEDAAATVEKQPRPTRRREPARARVAQHDVEVAVVVDIAELPARRAHRDVRKPRRGLVCEHARAVVHEQERPPVVVLREQQVPVAVAVDIARLDAAEAARDARCARIGLVGECARAVVHIDARLEQRADRGVPLPVREHDVLVAVTVDVDEGALVGVLGLHGKPRRGLVDELLPEGPGARGERRSRRELQRGLVLHLRLSEHGQWFPWRRAALRACANLHRDSDAPSPSPVESDIRTRGSVCDGCDGCDGRTSTRTRGAASRRTVCIRFLRAIRLETRGKRADEDIHAEW